MKPFQYLRPRTAKEAVEMVASDPAAKYIAGGTNLVDLMKRGIVSPEKLVDINHLPLKKIEKKSGLLRIGALALNSDVAQHKFVLKNHPLLAQALNAGASGQLCNMATVGGNILQQTRCPYFYDSAFPCNKRVLETGCSAQKGINRMHAIFGVTENRSDNSCISVHPSDMCVALAALDASVVILGQKGERRLLLTDFYRAPGERPDLYSNLEKGELILGVEIPDSSSSRYVHYLKVRDRAAYAFALVSVGVVLDMEGKYITSARLAMGGVAYKPWRLFDAEKILANSEVSESLFSQAAEVSLNGAYAAEHNSFKLKLAQNAILETLRIAANIL